MCHMLSYESYKRKLLNNVKHGVEQRLRELMKYLKSFKFLLQRNFNETHSFKFLLYLQLVKPVSNLFMRFRTMISHAHEKLEKQMSLKTRLPHSLFSIFRIISQIFAIHGEIAGFEHMSTT